MAGLIRPYGRGHRETQRRRPEARKQHRSRALGAPTRHARDSGRITQRETVKRYGILQVIGDHPASINAVGSAEMTPHGTARKEEYPHAKYLPHPLVLHGWWLDTRPLDFSPVGAGSPSRTLTSKGLGFGRIRVTNRR